jgi:hypothetical protein
VGNINLITGVAHFSDLKFLNVSCNINSTLGGKTCALKFDVHVTV